MMMNLVMTAGAEARYKRVVFVPFKNG